MRPTSNEILEHRSLSALEGLWKVVHHGNLIAAIAPEKTPRLVIYFRKLVSQINPVTPADFETQGPSVAIKVPAAELMRLPLNAVIGNSRLARDPCLPLPSEEIDTLNIDSSESKAKFINRYARAYETEDFIIPYSDGRSPPPDSNGGKAYYVAIEHNGDPFGIIIPCAEVFRFFYCTSSRMLYTILSDKILDPDHFIIDPAKSGTVESDSEIAVVWLRQWMLNSDRRHIARLFFTPGAFEEAKKVFLRAGGYADESAFEHALIALPPRHGQMNMKCIFKRFISDGHERIFITRLISASNWTLPFREIHYGRDNDGRRIATDKERNDLPDDKRTQRPNVLAEGAEINVLEDTSADNSIDPVELNDNEFESRFPELDKIYSPQIEKHDQKTKNNEGKQQLLLADGSLVEGSSSEHDGLVSTILRAMEKDAEIKRDDKEKYGVQSNPLKELEIACLTKLHERIEHLELARINQLYDGGLKIDYLSILDQIGLIKGKPVNILPDSIEGKSPTWLFLDKNQKHPRPVLIVHLTLEGKMRYMIDFMHRNGKPPDTSSLLLWNPEETQICDKVLEYAIRTCMRNRAVNLKNADLLRNYCANSIKHTFSEKNTSPKQIQLIEKIFAGANVINKWICGIEADT
jgi:hypothetical protein